MLDIISRSKATLLVGEGNFSFTAALINCIRLRLKNCTVVSTSYESEDDCLAKYGNVECQKNIEFLSNNGVKVVHGVDATDISATIPMKFDAIIFQFPHTGRKSSIKQNRNLLLRFFHSAKNVLQPDNGFVIVTLCAGQGGTPSDSVVREKCNTWQVIEMAAASNFILNEVKVFDGCDYAGYVSTGRRNWNNSFITSCAMSHMFSIGEMLPCLRKDWVVFDSTQSCLPSALDMRIEILKNSPDNILLHSVTKSVINRLGYVEHYIDSIIESQCINAAACGIVLESFEDDATDMIDSVMDIHANNIIHSDHNPTAYHFASYHGCGKTDGILANFRYNMVLVSGSSTPVLTQLMNVLANFCDFNIEISLRTLSPSHPIDHNKHEKHKIYLRSANQEETIGTSFHLKDMVFYQISVDEVMSLLRKDLNKRVYWTSNTKAVCRMRESILQNAVYDPILIHPTDFHHDVSVWVHSCEESVKHDISTPRLALLVSLIADEAFHSVNLLEEYEKDGRNSKLYRITYKSLHHALSKQQCSRLQLNVRRHMEQFFNVYLR